MHDLNFLYDILALLTGSFPLFISNFSPRNGVSEKNLIGLTGKKMLLRLLGAGRVLSRVCLNVFCAERLDDITFVFVLPDVASDEATAAS